MRAAHDVGFARACNVLARKAAETHLRLAADGVDGVAQFEVALRASAPRVRGRMSGLCATSATAPTEPALAALAGLLGMIRRGGPR